MLRTAFALLLLFFCTWLIMYFRLQEILTVKKKKNAHLFEQNVFFKFSDDDCIYFAALFCIVKVFL